MQPGQTVTPGDNQEPAWEYKPETAQTNQTPADLPAPSAEPPVEAKTQAPAPDHIQGESISWTASEFIAHDKSAGWYGMLALGTLILTAIIYLLTKDEVTAAVVILVAVVFGIVAGRKPRELEYKVDSIGVHIAHKTYDYDSFRSFAIVQEGAIESIWFMPLKRFMPIISIYFDPKDGDKIVDILSAYLPVEDHGLDPVDRLMHRLRF